MQPAVPERRREPRGAGVSADDVGAFDQGTEFSRWALARYIVGRVILDRLSWALLALVAVLVALVALAIVSSWVLHSTFLAVVLVLLALAVFAMRAVLRAVLRRLMAAALYGPLERRVREITNGAGGDVLAELRRVGLPGHLFTLPLLVVRLLGRRRADTVARMRRFEVERAVPRARRDELHLVVREAIGRRGQQGP